VAALLLVLKQPESIHHFPDILIQVVVVAVDLKLPGLRNRAQVDQEYFLLCILNYILQQQLPGHLLYQVLTDIVYIHLQVPVL
jgi:hypothetical protein